MKREAKYFLDIVPDYSQSGLKHTYGGDINRIDFQIISDELFDLIERFNRKVVRFYVLGNDTKKSLGTIMYITDMVGYKLKKCIEMELNATVRYASAGLSRFLDSPPSKSDYIVDNSFCGKVRRNFELKFNEDLNPIFWERFSKEVDSYYETIAPHTDSA